MEKKIDYMTSEVLEWKNTIEQLQNPTIRETMKSITEDIKETGDNGKKQLSDIKSNIRSYKKYCAPHGSEKMKYLFSGNCEIFT